MNSDAVLHFWGGILLHAETEFSDFSPERSTASSQAPFLTVQSAAERDIYTTEFSSKCDVSSHLQWFRVFGVKRKTRDCLYPLTYSLYYRRVTIFQPGTNEINHGKIIITCFRELDSLNCSTNFF